MKSKRTRRASYRSFLNETLDYKESPVSPPEDLDNWVEALRNGDQTHRDDILIAHYRIAASIVGEFLGTNSRRSDDLLGQAMLGLMQAVTWSGPHYDEAGELQPSRLTDNNITPYVTVTIRRFIREFIEEDRTVFMPGRTFRSKVAKGEIAESGNDEMTVIGVVSVMRLVMSDDPHTDREEDDSPKRLTVPYAVPIAHQEEPSPEFTEALTLAVVNDRERRIIELRAQGFGYKEIADELGCHVSRIGQLIPRIEERFNSRFA